MGFFGGGEEVDRKGGVFLYRASFQEALGLQPLSSLARRTVTPGDPRSKATRRRQGGARWSPAVAGEGGYSGKASRAPRQSRAAAVSPLSSSSDPDSIPALYTCVGWTECRGVVSARPGET